MGFDKYFEVILPIIFAFYALFVVFFSTDVDITTIFPWENIALSFFV